MSTSFLQAAEALVAANEQFVAGKLSPVDHREARESAIAGALVAMAAEMGTTLQAPMYVDSRGEFSIIALHQDGRQPNVSCGPYGEEFAAAMNRHNPRTGVNPGAVMTAEAGWCHLNHFDAERMVMERLHALDATAENMAPKRESAHRGC